jgi:hypothetical protein
MAAAEGQESHDLKQVLISHGDKRAENALASCFEKITNKL